MGKTKDSSTEKSIEDILKCWEDIKKKEKEDAGIHPETALAKSTDKFEKRFRFMEKELAEKNVTLKELTRKEIDKLWDKSKKTVQENMEIKKDKL